MQVPVYAAAAAPRARKQWSPVRVDERPSSAHEHGGGGDVGGRGGDVLTGEQR